MGEVARLVTREHIDKLEMAMCALPDSLKMDTDPLVEHFFAPGVYVRQMLLPAGMLVVGKIHKTRHVSIISNGHVTVQTESGFNDIKGPYTFINEPGDKRAVYAHVDTIWSTIHPTDETDLELIEKEVVADSYDDADLLEFRQYLEGDKQ